MMGGHLGWSYHLYVEMSQHLIGRGDRWFRFFSVSTILFNTQMANDSYRNEESSKQGLFPGWDVVQLPQMFTSLRCRASMRDLLLMWEMIDIEWSTLGECRLGSSMTVFLPGIPVVWGTYLATAIRRSFLQDRFND